MPSSNMWSLISIGTAQQYGGNEGYDDDPTQHYRYDSRVPNHKQLAEGDVVFIRDALHVLGAARIESVVAAEGAKLERRCPACNAVNVRERSTMLPRWRCSKCKAEFSEPLENIVDVTTYTARFDQSFRSAPKGITASALKKAAVAPNDQLAIERLEPGVLRSLMAKLFPSADDLFVQAALGKTLTPLDADSPPAIEPDSQYLPWEGDQRELVLRAIRARRGQAKFRKKLIESHGGKCMITGCALLDLLEAAHIQPYKGAPDNDIRNGLLLRADLHTLFDLNLMAIDPSTFEVAFSTGAREAGYGHLHGLKLVLAGELAPSKAALQRRWDTYSKAHWL